jgi:hypothetical protein
MLLLLRHKDDFLQNSKGFELAFVDKTSEMKDQVDLLIHSDEKQLRIRLRNEPIMMFLRKIELSIIGSIM